MAATADGRADSPGDKKRPRSALLLSARPHREVRLLTELPPNTVIHATFFLSVPERAWAGGTGRDVPALPPGGADAEGVLDARGHVAAAG